MEAALYRRLDGVARVSISQQRQAAEVVFAPGPHRFSAMDFRLAVGEADVAVLQLEIDVCGHVERQTDATWFVAGPNRFFVSAADAVSMKAKCISAVLDEEDGKLRLRPRG